MGFLSEWLKRSKQNRNVSRVFHGLLKHYIQAKTLDPEELVLARLTGITVGALKWGWL